MISSNINYNVGEVYGEVLFQLAKERNELDLIKSDFDDIDQFMFSEGDFGAILASPFLSPEQKNELVQKLFAGKVSELTISFLRAAGVRNRLAALADVIKKYNKLYRASKGHKDIWMTVSHALDDNEKEEICASLVAALRTENITLKINVEPAIIGGAIIRYSGKMIDNSIRTRLNRAVETIITKGRNAGTRV